MRTNPKYSNICWIRIGRLREYACYNCKMLEECDEHYDEITGQFDYPILDSFRHFGQQPMLIPIPGGVWDTR